MNIKKFIKQVTPPIVEKLLNYPARYGWFGNYSTWDEAKKKCVGYDSAVIFNKVKKAALSVEAGEAKFERDSVLFYKEEYNWQVLTCLMLIASRENGILHVTDFGGSLGSFFYQHHKILKMLNEVKWGIVEQPHFVDCGNESLLRENLNFYYTVKECLQHQKNQTLFLSSVLQYLETPFEQIANFLNFEFEYILIDRTAFTVHEQDEITVQKIHPKIYNASYPAWFFNERKFLGFFSKGYDIFLSFENEDFTNRKGGAFKGYLMIKKKKIQDEKNA